MASSTILIALRLATNFVHCISRFRSWRSAIETSLTGTFRLDVIKGRTLAMPRAETPSHWIAIGLHEDLNEAMRIAIREAIQYLVDLKGLTREDAYALCSIAVDFEVTQVVDSVKGIHALIPKAIFTR